MKWLKNIIRIIFMVILTSLSALWTMSCFAQASTFKHIEKKQLSSLPHQNPAIDGKINWRIYPKLSFPGAQMPVDGAYIQALLNANIPATEAALHDQQDFGYAKDRHVYQDPRDPTKRIIKISTSRDKQLANPNAHEEAQMCMQEIALSAKMLIDRNPSIHNKQARRKAVDNLLQDCQKNLTGTASTANLFESKKSPRNKQFLADLKSNTRVISDFMDITCKIAKASRKTLDAAGHERRSQNRPALVQEMAVDPNHPGRTHFIMYIPAGRFTARQRVLNSNSTQTSHSITSHHKQGLVIGNSSFVRMIVGTQESDGTVKILNDSFSGPGARMPYKDLQHADKYQRMAVKAITFLNQEEVIQAIAQRVYDQKLASQSDEGIRQILKAQKSPITAPDDATRETLIQLYFQKHHLVEVYTQVTSPSEAFVPGTDRTDADREQFEFVRDAIRAFDGGKDLKLEIETTDGGVIKVNGNYQGRHGAFGVNRFKTANDPLAGAGNKRFINQITDDTLLSLQDASANDDDFAEIKKQLMGLSNLNIAPTTSAAITKRESQLSPTRKAYREAMMDYQTDYQTLRDARAQNLSPQTLREREAALSARFKRINQIEAHIQYDESAIDSGHSYITSQRKKYFESNKKAMRAELKKLKATLIKKYPEGIPREAQSTYNRCAYLIEIHSLYHTGKWATNAHNFELQTLTASLATALGHANTKGCKSNNDRGQRLAQKIAGTAILNAINGNGLYDGEYFIPKATGTATSAENIDAQLMAIQTLHHTANMGVGGGKFASPNPQSFADNELLAKVASLSKLKKIGNVNFFLFILKMRHLPETQQVQI